MLLLFHQVILNPKLKKKTIRSTLFFEGCLRYSYSYYYDKLITSILAAPHPLLVHNLGGGFPAARIKSAYAAIGDGGKFRASEKRLKDEELARWILDLK